MSFRCFDWNWRRALAAIGLGALAVSNAPGAGPPPAGQRIEFSQPTTANDVISTNLSAFKPISDGLPQFVEPREQGTLDFQGLESSMDGLSAPVPQYLVIPNRRLQDRLERQKNWASMTPEEVLMESSSSFLTSFFQDSSKSAGRQEKNNRSRPDHSRSARQRDGLSPDSSADSDGSSASRKRQDQSDSDDGADLPADLKETERQFKDIQKRLRGDGDFNPFSTVTQTNTGFFDFFGNNSQKPSWLDQVAHDKAVMEQFKQALDSPLSPPLSRSFTVDPFESLVDLAPGVDTLKSAPLVRSPFPRSDGLESRSSALLPLPPGVSDSQFTGPSSSLFTQPRPQPPQQPSLTPPTPTFIFPKRAFQ